MDLTEFRRLFPEYQAIPDATLQERIQTLTPDQQRMIDERRTQGPGDLANPGFTPAPMSQEGLLLRSETPTPQERNQSFWSPWVEGGREFGMNMGQGAIEAVGAVLPAGSTPQNVPPPAWPPAETTVGQFGRAIGNFLPGAVTMGPGAFAAGNAIRYGVVPGAITEGAGQIFDEVSPEAGAYARVAGAILGTGGAALTGHAGISAGLPRSQQGGAQIIGNALRDAKVTPQEIALAEDLVNEGLAFGVGVTWPEALSTVTRGRVDLTGMQRVIEQARRGQPIMSEFMGARPPAIRAAVQDQTSQLGPLTPPSVAGPQIRSTATERINDLRMQINEMTAPQYLNSAGTAVDPIAFQQLMADPLFAETLNSIRGDNTYGRLIRGFEDNSIAVMDAVKKRLDDITAAQPGEATGAAIRGSVAGQARAAGQAASTEYGQALSTQAFARENWLAPLEQGPLGRFSRTDDLAEQIRAVFPTNPLAGTEADVRLALGMIAEASPDAAQAVVRHHLENVFNETTQALRSGPNQAGGGSFVAALQGNEQQYRNLEAAFVAAFPDGAERFEGFQRLMQVLEATGRRQPANSATWANIAAGQQLSQAGTPIGRLATTAASPTRWLSSVSNWYANFLTGRNGAALARIITDPASGDVLRRLATGGPWRDLTAIAGELVLGQAPQMRSDWNQRESIANVVAAGVR